MSASESGEWMDALVATLAAEGREADLEDLRRTVEVAQRILLMREAGERHATVVAARSVPLASAIEELASSLDTLGLSVVESAKSISVVARTAAELAAKADALASGGGSEDFSTLCRAQAGALSSILSAMQGNAQLATQARAQLSALTRAAAQTEQRLRLAQAAEKAVVDSIEQVLGSLERLARAKPDELDSTR